jgi:hypothetical protein
MEGKKNFLTRLLYIYFEEDLLASIALEVGSFFWEDEALPGDFPA